MSNGFVNTGTITLVQYSDSVAGIGTNFLVSGVRSGDVLLDRNSGQIGIISNVISDGSLTLVEPWAHDSGSNKPFTITLRDSAERSAANTTALAELITKLDAGLYSSPNAYGTLSERDTHNAEDIPFIYQATDDASGDLVVYLKTGSGSSDWSGPFALRGQEGAQGLEGPAGPSFQPNASGLTADRSTHDNEFKNFSFLDTENSVLYFKLSSASADWSSGIPFGRGEKGDTGSQGIQGAQGDVGNNGWSPNWAIQNDVNRRVLQVIGWIGGTGTAPATGLYIGSSGYVTNIANAIDIRGQQGLSGNGSGDMLKSEYDSNSDGKVDAADSADSVEWNNIQNKPNTINPVAAAIIFGG